MQNVGPIYAGSDFECQRCMQVFDHPDDGNMMYDPDLEISLCGHCCRDILEGEAW